MAWLLANTLSAAIKALLFCAILCAIRSVTIDKVSTVNTAKAMAALITVSSPRRNSRENSLSANLAHICHFLS